jgi:hypothetical protein
MLGLWKPFVMEHVSRAVVRGDLAAFVDELRREKWLLSDPWVAFQAELLGSATLNDRGAIIGALFELDPAILHCRLPPQSQAIEFAFAYANTHLVPLLTRVWPVPDDLPHAAGLGKLARIQEWFDESGALRDADRHYGTRATCKLPVDVTHEGVIGCPTHVTYHDGKETVTYARFEYDKRGRLVSYTNDEGETSPIDWTSGEPKFLHRFPLKIRPRVLEWSFNGKSVDFRIEVDPKSRPLRATSYNRSVDPPTIDEQLTYDWKADRLLRVHTERPGEKSSFELRYDCSKASK